MNSFRNRFGSLFISRLMILTLAVGLALLWRSNAQLNEQFDIVKEHALSVYPYAPKIDRNFNFIIDYFGLKYFGDYNEDWGLLYTGASEKPELYLLRSMMKKIAPKKDGVFVDVGANKGGHSLFMSLYSKKVVSYEPYPPVLEKFQFMVNENNLENIIIRGVGLGDKEETASFFVSPKSITTGTFKQGFNADEKKFGEFQIVRGDDDLLSLGIEKIHILKVDVEGNERYVLDGLKETLSRDRPLVLVELLSFSNSLSSFRDGDDFRTSFPEKYTFYRFDTYNLYTGEYSLKELDFEEWKNLKSSPFKPKPRNIAAVPLELQSIVFD